MFESFFPFLGEFDRFYHHFYDEGKMTLVLVMTSLSGREISIHLIFFYFDGFPYMREKLRPALSMSALCRA